MIKTAIVILNWNTRNHLETFLPSLVKYSTFPDVSIVLADNASTDDSVAFVQNNYPQIQIIQLALNFGFAGGYNNALVQVEATYYVILNSDVEVTENWLNPLISLLDQNEEIAACMPKLLSYRQRNSFEYAGGAGGYIDKFGYPFCKGRIFDSIEEDRGQYDGIYEVFWATGACMFVKASVFHQLGGFDTFFFAHQEEIDLCWRMKNNGYKIFCNTQSVVYHLGGGTLPKTNPRKTYLNFRNNLILLYKNLPNSKRSYVLLLKLILDGVAGLKFLASGKFKDCLAIIKAHFSFYNYIINHKKTLVSNKMLLNTMYNKSIVVEHFVRKINTYDQLPDKL